MDRVEDHKQKSLKNGWRLSDRTRALRRAVPKVRVWFLVAAGGCSGNLVKWFLPVAYESKTEIGRVVRN